MESPSPLTLDAKPAGPAPAQPGLRRSMGARHLVMIAMGGVIGSGLFLSSGYTISQAGPLGAVLAYLVGAFVVYLVMACLGELAIAYPVSGAFHIYAARSIGPATGFATAWLYWLCWAVAIGSEFTASGLLMQRWFPGVDVWVWCLVFAAVLFGFNAVSARFFGESEFWFAIIKVGAIIGLIVLGGAALFGFRPLSDGGSHPFLFENFNTAGGLFPNGFTGVLVTVLAVFYAFSGSELIGVAAGETKDPATSIPKAMRTTVIRLLIFFVGAIAVIAATIPYTEVGLDESPFVTVFSAIGIPFAADIMNFVIITALLSAGNSGLFSCARMLYSLADEGHAPQALQKADPPRHPADRPVGEHGGRHRVADQQRGGPGNGVPGAGVRGRIRRGGRVDVHHRLALLPPARLRAERRGRLAPWPTGPRCSRWCPSWRSPCASSRWWASRWTPTRWPPSTSASRSLPPATR